MASTKIQKNDLDPSLLSSLGNLKMHTETQTASVEGQTEFAIPLETFDVETDVIWVYDGMLTLHKDVDYVIEGGKIVLVEGVPVGATITTYILKNVESIEDDEYISGVNIEPGSIPLDRLAEEIPVPDVSGQIDDHNTAEDAHDGVLAKADHTHTEYSPAYTYGTEDLEPGVTPLETGKLHIVYE